MSFELSIVGGVLRGALNTVTPKAYRAAYLQQAGERGYNPKILDIKFFQKLVWHAIMPNRQSPSSPELEVYLQESPEYSL